jgi:hypothetical protein
VFPAKTVEQVSQNLGFTGRTFGGTDVVDCTLARQVRGDRNDVEVEVEVEGYRAKKTQ